MMNIALIGYGKMGKAIEEILLERGHNVIVKLNQTPTKQDLINVDVAIEFSRPEVAFDNLNSLIQNQIPTICGTTGWLEKLEEIKTLNQKFNSAFLYGSNFSLGVNLFFELNAHLAKLISNYDQYQVEIEEIHHTQKLDAPSGTAITLAEGIIQNSSKKDWQLDENTNPDHIPIFAKRLDNVSGTHTVFYISEVDTIEIKHTAHTRKGFALGAVIAAEWIANKKGFFTMKDVLNLR